MNAPHWDKKPGSPLSHGHWSSRSTQERSSGLVCHSVAHITTFQPSGSTAKGWQHFRNPWWALELTALEFSSNWFFSPLAPCVFVNIQVQTELMVRIGFRAEAV